MNMKVYGLLGILLCNVICINGMNRPFFTSTSYNVEASDNSFEDKLDSLQNKLAELQLQINPPLLKSWLMWSGKVALVTGGVSLTTYFAWRYYFDIASPQDVRNAFNEVNQDREEARKCIQEAVQDLGSTVTQRLDTTSFVLQQLSQGDNDYTRQRAEELSGQLCGVRVSLHKTQEELIGMLDSSFKGRVAQIDEFGRQTGLGLSALEKQVEQQSGSQQKQLDAMNQVINGLRKDTLELAVDTTNKRSEIESDSYLINQLFENNSQSSLLEN